MCNRKTYKRFLNLSKYHSKYSCNHVIYDTKLGKRDVYISNPDYRTNSIDLTYFDGVDSYIPNLDILNSGLKLSLSAAVLFPFTSIIPTPIPVSPPNPLSLAKAATENKTINNKTVFFMLNLLPKFFYKVNIRFSTNIVISSFLPGLSSFS